MIISHRDEATPPSKKTSDDPSDKQTEELRDENGMTRDDIFDQLVDEDHVVTSGMGSRLPLTDSPGGSAATGYSAGVGSGDGAD